MAWLFGDRGIPMTWRHMNGYESHTYCWINADGQIFWVKYHFISDQGIQCLTQAEADRLVSVDGGDLWVINYLPRVFLCSQCSSVPPVAPSH